MAAVKVGTITAPAGAGAQTITGLGFQPKLILFYAGFDAAANTDAVNQGGNIMIGCATSATDEWCCATEDEDAQATTDNAGGTFNDRSICILTANGTVSLRADVASFEANGFTLNWTTTSSGILISYLAVGGTDITNAKAGTFTLAAVGTPQAFAGVGFQPDALLVVAWGGGLAGADVINTIAANAALVVGAASGAGSQYAAGYSSQDNAGTTNANREQLTNGISVQPQSNLNITQEWAAALASFDPDGFTLSASDLPIAARIHGYLAIEGVNLKVVSDTQPLTDTTKATTGVGFQPDAGIFFGAALAAATGTPTAGGAIMFGASDGTNEGAIATTADDNTADSETTRYMSVLKPIVHIDPISEAVVGLADVASFDPDGVTLNWASTNGTAYRFGALLFTATATPAPDYGQIVTARGGSGVGIGW